MSCNDTATVNQVAASEQEKAKQMLLMYFLDTNATISEVSDDGTVYKVVFSDGHYVEIDDYFIPVISKGNSDNWMVNGIQTNISSDKSSDPVIRIDSSNDLYINDIVCGVEIKNIAYDIDNYISYILALDDKLLFGFSDGEQKEKYFTVEALEIKSHNGQVALIKREKAKNEGSVRPIFAF